MLIAYIAVVLIMLFMLMYLKRTHENDWVDDEVDMIAMSVLWPLTIPGFLVILFWKAVIQTFNRIIDDIVGERK